MNPNFITFDLERMQSLWENEVEYNLTESGVHPMSMRDLVDDPALLDELLDMELVYPQTNGIPELRDAIAALYPYATRDNVIVTVGAIQANFSTMLAVMQPHDELAVMTPNYSQLWGAAQNHGFTTRTFSLDQSQNWALNVDELNAAVTPRTKLIAICNPNNPSGHILTSAEMDAVVAAADRVGAWLLADEVYAGCERTTDEFTPSFYGRYDKVLAVNSMSKAYGLPGLRLGWVVTTPEMTHEIWQRQEYQTIATTPLSNRLAAYALQPQTRTRILDRTRAWVRNGYANFDAWMVEHNDLFSYTPPDAAAIAFVHYNAAINSTELVHRLIRDKSALVVPGDAFGMDGHLRIAFGQDAAYVNEGLARLVDVLRDVVSPA